MSIDTGLEQLFYACVETVSECNDRDQGMLGSLARLTCTVVWGAAQARELAAVALAPLYLLDGTEAALAGAPNGGWF